MSTRFEDGSAGDANYEVIGTAYSSYRQPDPRIESLILRALGDAESIVNVGAGAGSYEPRDRHVTPIEPSAQMRSQRGEGLAVALDGVAESLPLTDKSMDAAMATFSVHQWSNPQAGLLEMRRVTLGPIVILTCDPMAVRDFWLHGYAPQVLDVEATRYPSLALFHDVLDNVDVINVPVPLDCADGFNEAYYGRPEMFLDKNARQSCSAWSFVDAATTETYVSSLETDLATSRWDRRLGHLRNQPTYEGSLVLVVSRH